MEGRIPPPNLPRPLMVGAFLCPREKRVSHICVWRYVRPFVRNNNCSVCNCNRIGGFSRDDGLPQHLAVVSLAAEFYFDPLCELAPAGTGTPPLPLPPRPTPFLLRSAAAGRDAQLLAAD